MVLRIPVISSIEGLGAAVRQRLQASAALQQVEIVDVPVPTQQRWALDATQRQTLEEAEFVLADASLGAKLLLDRANFLPNDAPKLLQSVKWVQSTYAGVEPFFQQLTQSEPPTFTLTRAGGIMPNAMAQYVFGWVIALERKFLEVQMYQKEHNYARTELKYRSFRPLTVSILGLGEIGRAIGRLMKTAGFRVVGFKRRVSAEDREKLKESADQVSSDLDDVLSVADFVVNILPSTDATRGLLDVENLQVCKEKKPVFINVGRGDVIKEKVLVAALDEGLFSKAVLDVFEKEPLPTESPLWSHPSVLLTPHVAALSLPDEVADVFVKNLDLRLKEKPMLYGVDWANGY
ncbi:D-isomer specific 2-hydroxyacid dehydrogenase [Phytophthora palmivora]|uniref:D-isomer specific 2-hydroxyacid dehydrogenase n=1 Tax=Phytophthora palmivora TaxID=4796 RepID=A0A2P4XCK2_9STRA|nr:D-isomer specific 2-hydroxyacid dehydrogenase [Phytophthora palmivora]